MADFDYYNDIREHPGLLRRERGSGILGVLVALLIIGGAAAAIWWNHDSLVQASQSASSMPTNLSAKFVSRQDFEELKERATEELRSTAASTGALKAEIQRMSEQVAKLTANIETLQLNAQPSVQPVWQPNKPALVSPPRRPPSQSRPAGAISVGGAPLPPQPAVQ